MKTSKNETYLTGNEKILFTFNQARDEVNLRMGKSFSLQTFGMLMGKSSVRPAYIGAAEVTSGLYSDNDLQQFIDEYSAGTMREGREKKEKVTISAAEYEELLRAKKEANNAAQSTTLDAE